LIAEDKLRQRETWQPVDCFEQWAVSKVCDMADTQIGHGDHVIGDA